MSDIAIRVENLGKKYHIGTGPHHDTLRDAIMARFRRDGHSSDDQTIWALKDVSFQVEHGEVLGIIGRNGAGKSTLLKILSRITEPTTGRAQINGRVGSLLEVGTGFHPELTGRENVYLSGAILGMTRAEIDRKFDEIVAFSGVEKFLDTPFKRYSSGMRVRLGFAVAAHLDPEILLIDEVLAVGDAQFQKRCLGKMEDVAREGRTVLFVSHNMTAILNLCDRAMLLSSGRVSLDSRVDRVVSRYLSADQDSNVFQPRVDERGGDQTVCVERLRIHPNPPQTGKPLEFLLDVWRRDGAGDDLPIELAVTLLSGQGTKLMQLYSRHMGVVFSLPPGRSRIRVAIDSLPLVPGDYWVNLWVGAGNLRLDWQPECMLLSVIPGSMPAAPSIDDRGYPFVIPSTWEIVRSG